MPDHPNIPELQGSFPVVLYFGSRADADDFIAIVRQAKPGLVAKSLAPLTIGPLGGKSFEAMPEGPIDYEKIEFEEQEQIRRQREAIRRRNGNGQY